MALPMKLHSKLQVRIGRNIWVLCFMILIACLYVIWIAYIGRLTSSIRLDGTIGMLLGLYICSHPAANMLDMLLFMTADTRERIFISNIGCFWLGLNVLTLLASWVTIFSGALRFVQQ